MRFITMLVAAWAMALPALAQPGVAPKTEDEAKVLAVIAEWYERVSHFEARQPWVLFAPGHIDGGPGYSKALDRGIDGMRAAVIRGPWINYELASRATLFRYDIDELVVSGQLAKVDVWERGYTFAAAAQKTYELAADAMFVLEKQPDGRWLILVHDANSQGIPPNKITDPMPDLSGDYYAKCGAACNREADIKKSKEW